MFLPHFQMPQSHGVSLIDLSTLEPRIDRDEIPRLLKPMGMELKSKDDQRSRRPGRFLRAAGKEWSECSAGAQLVRQMAGFHEIWS